MRKIKRKIDSKGTKDKIIKLFFEKNLRPTDIANKLNVRMSYITKIIQKIGDIFKKKSHERKTTKKTKKFKREYMHKTKEKKIDKKNKNFKN